MTLIHDITSSYGYFNPTFIQAQIAVDADMLMKQLI
jgi:hypothetical protein